MAPLFTTCLSTVVVSRVRGFREQEPFGTCQFRAGARVGDWAGTFNWRVSVLGSIPWGRQNNGSPRMFHTLVPQSLWSCHQMWPRELCKCN
jgi:hypothetical protein